jgi:small subunit ribosomal protein S16
MQIVDFTLVNLSVNLLPHMLKIRLQRVGRIHDTSFRIVLTDSKNSTKSGRFKEILGSYDPSKSRDSLEAERIKYWISQGASPTPTIHNLLVKKRIINAKKINVSAKSKKTPAPAEATENKPVVKEVVTEEVSKETVSPEEIAPAKDATTPTLALGEIGASTEASE